MRLGTIGLSVFLGVAALGAVVVAGAVGAAPPKAQGRPAAPPPSARGKIPLSPEGLHWAMSPNEVQSFYDRVFDGDFVAKYKAARISEQASIDAELRDL